MMSLIFDGILLLPKQSIDINDAQIIYIINQEYL